MTKVILYLAYSTSSSIIKVAGTNTVSNYTRHVKYLFIYLFIFVKWYSLIRFNIKTNEQFRNNI